MLRFARWHIWLGWLVGFPILMWTITGLVMIVRPIEGVRGDELQKQAPAIELGRYALPDFDEPVNEVRLVQQPSGPVWVWTSFGQR